MKTTYGTGTLLYGLQGAKIHGVKVPKINPANKKSTGTTVSIVTWTDGTRHDLDMQVVAVNESEYTDPQFFDDLDKASKQLDIMEAEALREHAKGNTRKFPA
jgi:hypothetical protein